MAATGWQRTDPGTCGGFFALDENGNRSLISTNYDLSRFWFNGQSYADKAAFNIAAGMTKSGITRQTAAPRLVESQLVANNNNLVDTTGWATFLRGWSGYELPLAA